MSSAKKGFLKLLEVALPNNLKKSLLHLSYYLDREEFARFAHVHCVAPSMPQSLAALAAHGFCPNTVFDVGANQGGWSREAHRIWPKSKIILFEPNDSLRAPLERAAHEIGADVFYELLGATAGKLVNFNRMTDVNATGSSVLNERSDIPRIVEQRSMKTLDDFIGCLKPPGFLKMDVQGYELEVMKGAVRSLPSFEAVLMEVALIDTIEGAPLLRDVLNFMDGIGFVACDFAEMHRRPLDGALSQVDIIFLRKGSPILADKRFS